VDVTYLFDEGGTAIALLTDERTVWSPSLRFLGSFPLSNDPTFVVDGEGKYFGEVIDDRLCRRSDPPYITSPGRRTEPMQPAVRWGSPPMGSRTMLPPRYEDIPRSLLA
jgi:hypothetical protein